MAERLKLARPVMRRCTGLDAHQAWSHLLKERQNIATLQLATEDDIAIRINTVNLKNRLRDIETNCRNRFHAWLLRIVGALTAPTSMALTCRWRSRPQHQKRTARSRLCLFLIRTLASGKKCERPKARATITVVGGRGRERCWVICCARAPSLVWQAR